MTVELRSASPHNGNDTVRTPAVGIPTGCYVLYLEYTKYIFCS